jgi:hypothetical protein
MVTGSLTTLSTPSVRAYVLSRRTQRLCRTTSRWHSSTDCETWPGESRQERLKRIDLIRANKVICSIDERFRRAVRDLNIDLAIKPATVVGRLHMGDFSPASLRCRIDTYAGSILCDFDIELKDAVLNAMDEMVMASGMAQLQPDGSTIRTLYLNKLETLPTATSNTLEQLAVAQGVGPIESADELVGEPIPDEEFDAFLAAIGRYPERDA